MRLAAVDVADRELPGEGHEAVHQFVASGEIPLAVVRVEKLFVSLARETRASA